MKTENHRPPEWHQYEIDDNLENYRDLLFKALDRQALNHPSYTLSFYPLESVYSAYFGARSNGTHWTFKVYGHKQNPKYDPAYNFSYNWHRYTIQKFFLQLSSYTLIQQEAHCSCGSYRIHTILCLPDKLVRACNEIIKASNSLHRRSLLETFSLEMLVYLASKPISFSVSLKRSMYAI